MSHDDDDDETWLLDEGGRVIEWRAAHGGAALTPRDRLIRCLWVADYAMRNAGDLGPAADLHPAFLPEGRTAAAALGLSRTAAAFGLPPHAFERVYFALFERIVAEIRRG